MCRGGGGGGGGAKEECVKEIFFLGGGHACGLLYNFSKMTENAIITIKLLIFSAFSVMLLSGLRIHHPAKLKYHRLLCYTTDINLLITINKPEIQRLCLSCLELNAEYLLNNCLHEAEYDMKR